MAKFDLIDLFLITISFLEIIILICVQGTIKTFLLICLYFIIIFSIVIYSYYEGKRANKNN